MKKVLIATYALNSGGVETSLLSLLNKLKDNYDVTLLLVKKEGVLLNDVPNNIKIITIPFKKEYYNVFGDNELNKISDKLLFELFKLINRLFTLFRKRNMAYKFFLKFSDPLEETYDYAFDYHGYGYFGTGYVALKVNANKKYTWIHSTRIEWLKNTKCFYSYYDKVITVSNYIKDIFINDYPNYKDKTKTFYNILDVEKINVLSNEFVPDYDSNIVNLLTVGRISKEKRYDLVLDIAMDLKKKGIKFKWYIIGTGVLKNHIDNRVIKDGLKDNVILLGEKKNPYPYFKNCDIYVQTSSFEGYCGTIEEAKVFNKPIVCTDIPTFREQIKDKETGFICNSKEKVIDRIIELVNDEELFLKLENNLKSNQNSENNIDELFV